MTEHRIKEYDKVKYSDKDLWWTTTKVAVGCFFILGIYFRFLVVENTSLEFKKEIEGIRDEFDVKNRETNRRLDTKTDRNKGYIDENKSDINELKKPNTDHEK